MNKRAIMYFVGCVLAGGLIAAAISLMLGLSDQWAMLLGMVFGSIAANIALVVATRRGI